MSSEPTNAEKLRRLPWSIFSEATNAVFYYLTFFGSVFVLFLSELGLARLIGNEHHFIHLWRGMRTDPGTASSQAVASVRRKANRAVSDPALMAAMEECAEALARGDLEAGAMWLRRIIIASLPMDSVKETPSEILRDCAQRLDEFGAERQEYMLLALHAMQEGW